MRYLLLLMAGAMAYAQVVTPPVSGGITGGTAPANTVYGNNTGTSASGAYQTSLSLSGSVASGVGSGIAGLDALGPGLTPLAGYTGLPTDFIGWQANAGTSGQHALQLPTAGAAANQFLIFGSEASGISSASWSTPHSVASMLTCPSSSASGTTYTCNTTPTFVPAAGDVVVWLPDIANTGNVTLNVNGAGAKPVHRNMNGGGSNISTGQICASPCSFLLEYDGTNWQQLTLPGGGTGTSGSMVYANAPTMTGILNLSTGGVLESTGTVVTVASCGTPAVTGGGFAGTFAAGSATCNPVLTFPATVAHGFVCSMTDETTAAATFRQTAQTTTTATFTGTSVASADAVVFSCTAY